MIRLVISYHASSFNLWANEVFNRKERYNEARDYINKVAMENQTQVDHDKVDQMIEAEGGEE